MTNYDLRRDCCLGVSLPGGVNISFEIVTGSARPNTTRVEPSRPLNGPPIYGDSTKGCIGELSFRYNVLGASGWSPGQRVTAFWIDKAIQSADRVAVIRFEDVQFDKNFFNSSDPQGDIYSASFTCSLPKNL
jgi:hypothetical protein